MKRLTEQQGVKWATVLVASMFIIVSNTIVWWAVHFGGAAAVCSLVLLVTFWSIVIAIGIKKIVLLEEQASELRIKSYADDIELARLRKSLSKIRRLVERAE